MLYFTEKVIAQYDQSGLGGVERDSDQNEDGSDENDTVKGTIHP